MTDKELAAVFQGLLQESRAACDAIRAKLTEAEDEARHYKNCCDSYAVENQQFHDTIVARDARIERLGAALREARKLDVWSQAGIARIDAALRDKGDGK